METNQTEQKVEVPTSDLSPPEKPGFKLERVLGVLEGKISAEDLRELHED